MAKSWLEAAVTIDETFHGPLPDVVSTQGRHLRPRPETPVFEREHDAEFVKNLERRLNSLIFVERLRYGQYGKDAEEWPPSHTPEELRERFAAEQSELRARLEAPTPSDSGSAETPSITALPEEPTRSAKKRRIDDMSSPPSDCPPTPRSPTYLPHKRRRLPSKRGSYLVHNDSYMPADLYSPPEQTILDSPEEPAGANQHRLPSYSPAAEPVNALPPVAVKSKRRNRRRAGKSAAPRLRRKSNRIAAMGIVHENVP